MKSASKYLNALVAAKVEIKLSGVCDADIDGGAGRNVSALATLLFLVSAEKACVVPLLHHDKRDAWLVVSLQLDAGFTDGRQLVLQQLQKLTFRHAVPVEDDAVWLIPASRFVEHDQKLPVQIKLNWTKISNFLKFYFNTSRKTNSTFISVFKETVFVCSYFVKNIF